jgi:hypothetical protein
MEVKSKVVAGVRRSKDGLIAPQHGLLYRNRRRPGVLGELLISRLRVKEIERIIRSRHGYTVDTEDGEQYAWLIAQHLREIDVANLLPNLEGWCHRWTPLLKQEQVAAICQRVLSEPRRFKADTLGELLGLKDEERSNLGVTTIGALDVPKSARGELRAAAKRTRDRMRAEQRRRTRGARPRAEYLESSLTRIRPWEKEGISRRTWERRRKSLAEAA